ncbi:MAG: tRNA (adenosine(37)-N6)-threonylcarbamoyltransferase complex ATPase subunit type 1 TsaE [Candidatus Jacksonbacteria bacterium]|jgi:tRNA threonylcarbamoyladenosine biosynthesis protein TsaE|nr:tRNA (adenosine(37)-N6)-threonylcarbamoyltransferase complex ATPase subunit type 1 TsaE [Candidatus Jacksonbacteria bacterium]MBT6034132.1 tRNA (adenosine(37)-N6)-threonylcarbamoyltransferase complex ATPase subunit type 1 TsaE [Candidatus Jacksonbacteria bacterium]MBT6301064.1 tRNA (adenosine(37)-N6)-threonylcarbamoyltransferase complex ATPase subunit type 1 TsaE [Candidatus Jacksonbacteria bacterium]MBT6756921.1 tRNA (adenosine(37)-N6)-threonylcarbamoyltransferase complex ATPase subunit type
MEKINISSLEDLKKYAKTLASELSLGDIVVLSGDLGSGKTTFVQLLAQAFDIPDKVTSPTYTYIHEYKIPQFAKESGILAHMDFYRIENEQVFHTIGTGDYLGSPHVINIIEWGEKFESLLPFVSKKIEFILEEDKTRTLLVHK